MTATIKAAALRCKAQALHVASAGCAFVGGYLLAFASALEYRAVAAENKARGE